MQERRPFRKLKMLKGKRTKERKDFQRTLEIIAKRSIQVFDYLHTRIELVGLQA